MIRLLLAFSVLHCSFATDPTPAAIIETDHFRIVSDSELTYAQAVRIGQTAEATYEAAQQLPFGISLASPEAPHVVHLVNQRIHLNHHEGARDAAGVFLPDQNKSLVHLPRGAVPVTLHETLVHEITHQLQQDWIQTLPVWLSEGLAVYMAAAPLKNGRLEPEATDLQRSPQLKRFQSKQVHTIELEALLNLDRTEWNHLFETNPNGVQRFYLTAYLLTHYFLQLSDSHAIHTLGDLPYSNATASINHRLLAGRSIAELETEFIEAYAEEQFDLIPMRGYFSAN